MTDTLPGTVARELRVDRVLSGFARFYAFAAALLVGALALPLYESSDARALPIPKLPEALGFMVVAVSVALLMLLGIGMFRLRLETMAMPLTLAFVSVVGAFVLLIGGGSQTSLSLSAFGGVTLALCSALAMVGVIHAMTLSNLWATRSRG